MPQETYESGFRYMDMFTILITNSTRGELFASGEYPCPVCGYGLSKPATDFTICPSCGVEFGYSDAGISHSELRKEWISFGAPWSSRVEPRPIGWNPWDQLIKTRLAGDIPWQYGIVVSEVTSQTSAPRPIVFTAKDHFGITTY